MKRPTPAKTKMSARAIGESVKTWRKLRGLTAQQLADKANTSRSTITRLENGDPSVSVETVLNVATMLGILDRVCDAFDPYETDYGRLFADKQLPQRVRNRQ
jgi:transcriptional regulator with XRE-family HTH domain